MLLKLNCGSTTITVVLCGCTAQFRYTRKAHLFRYTGTCVSSFRRFRQYWTIWAKLSPKHSFYYILLLFKTDSCADFPMERDLREVKNRNGRKRWGKGHRSEYHPHKANRLPIIEKESISRTKAKKGYHLWCPSECLIASSILSPVGCFFLWSKRDTCALSPNEMWRRGPVRGIRCCLYVKELFLRSKCVDRQNFQMWGARLLTRVAHWPF